MPYATVYVEGQPVFSRVNSDELFTDLLDIDVFANLVHVIIVDANGDSGMYVVGSAFDAAEVSDVFGLITGEYGLDEYLTRTKALDDVLACDCRHCQDITDDSSPSFDARWDEGE